MSWLPGRTRLGLEPLVEAPGVKELPDVFLDSAARYLGTYVRGDLASRVADHGLRARSSSRLRLSQEGLDVVRLAGSFRIPARALRGARHSPEVEGRPVAPHGVLLVGWQHGDHRLETAFRLADLDADKGRPAPTEKQTAWIRKIGKLTRKQEDVA